MMKNAEVSKYERWDARILNGGTTTPVLQGPNGETLQGLSLAEALEIDRQIARKFVRHARKFVRHEVPPITSFRKFIRLAVSRRVW